MEPHANLAWSLLSRISEVRVLALLEDIDYSFLFFQSHRQPLVCQFQCDENVRTLLKAIRDAFEFANDADITILKNIQPESMQAKILNEMLHCVSESVVFIESYAKDVRIGTSSY